MHLVAQSCLTLGNPMDWSPPGSSAHEIFQARILEWVAISYSRASSQPRIKLVSPASAGRLFTTEPLVVVELLSCVPLLRPHGL